MGNLTSPLYVTGVCPQSKKIMLGGIFRMHDQVGFPVDCCIDECRERGYLIDWLEALCDCWLNDCLKYDSFVRQITSQLPDLALDQKFKETGAALIAIFPKIKRNKNPVDVVCRYILTKKRKHSWDNA